MSRPMDFEEIDHNGEKWGRVLWLDIDLIETRYLIETRSGRPSKDQLPLTDIRFTREDPMSGGIWLYGPLKGCYL